MTVYEFLGTHNHATSSEIAASLQELQIKTESAFRTWEAGRPLSDEQRHQLHLLDIANSATVLLLDSRGWREKYDAKVYSALAHVAVTEEEGRIVKRRKRGDDGGSGFWQGWKGTKSDNRVREIIDADVRMTKAQERVSKQLRKLCGGQFEADRRGVSPYPSRSD